MTGSDTFHDGHVDVTTLRDGMLVRLAGRLDESAADAMRRALLSPRRRGCADVIVDAGDVTGVADPALAILLAGRAWTEVTGGRFSFSRISEPLRREAHAAGVGDALRALPEPGRRYPGSAAELLAL